jgi:hypothetical protein
MWGLLDTGATDCILPLDVADLIQPVPFAGQWFLNDYAGVPHEVSYGGVQCRIRLKDRLIRWTSVIAFGNRSEGTALWGRCGFLDQFRVTFDGPARHFTIRLPSRLPAKFGVETSSTRPSRSASFDDLVTPDDQQP